jgi:hypothetical protein
MRSEDPPAGWREVKRSADGGVVFSNGQTTRSAIAQLWADGADRQPPPPDRSAEARRYAKALTDDRAGELAEAFGLPVKFLEELDVGWDGRGWTFPEQDPKGRVIGIPRRYPDGSKRTPKGQRRGLNIPRGLAELPDPVLLVEGPSDVLACRAMGLAAVGRPSNRAGAAMLAELLRDRPDVIVVGEHDRKANGKWPGRDGALHVARELSRLLGRPIKWALPPDQAKDLRNWLDAEDVRGAEALAEAGQRLLELLRESAVEVSGPEPYRSADEARAAVNVMARAARDHEVSMSELIADWYARRGPDVLAPALKGATPPPSYSRYPPLPPREHAVKYAAAACGMTRQHFHRLGQVGQIRRLLRAGDVTHGLHPDRLSDRALRPLVRLLDDHADEIPRALQDAAEVAKAEDRRLNGRHLQDVVSAIKPPEPRLPLPAVLRRRVLDMLETARKVKAPAEFIKSLERAHAAAVEWMDAEGPP